MSHTVAHNPNLYQWKRFAKKTPSAKPVAKPENDIESWLRKVEEATDRAVETTFAVENPRRQPRQRPSYYAGDDIMHTVDRLRDDDAAHEEAQELVTNWMNEKLRFNFLEDEDDIPTPDHSGDGFSSVAGSHSVENATHEKWYEDSETFIQNYLQSSNVNTTKRKSTVQPPEDDFLGSVNIYEADENSVVQALMKKMMDKPVIKKKTMKKMQIDDSKLETKQRKTKDPRTTMEMRHKEVKEARIRRQREDDKRKQNEMVKREAKFKAQQILKKEEARKVLRAKQEEEAIQLEMAKLRKEMIEQRKREDVTKKERDKTIGEAILREEEEKLKRRQVLEVAEREKQKKQIMDEISRLEEKEKRVAEVMKKREIENRKLLHRCLSTWCKMVMSQRVKLGKAKAMSDWKCMRKALGAWKTHTRNQRLDQETRLHQDCVREAKLKEKRAIDCQRSRLLRKCFSSWKVWVRTEQERKEILKQQENTKAKMRALLDAVASGNIKSAETQSELPATLQSLDSNDSSNVLSCFETQKPTSVAKPKKSRDQGRHPNIPGKPKNAWQVTKRDVWNLQPEGMRVLEDSSPRSDSTSVQQRGLAYDPFGNRHKFQKEVIDQQRMLLQEQKRMIEEMQEQKRLQVLQNEIAVLQQNQKKLSHQKAPNPERAPPSTSETVVSLPRTATSDQELHGAPKSASSHLKKHPVVTKMEERAAERLRKRKELEEIKRKKEEERVRRLQEEEEKKQREEREQKERELEARREAKRLQRKLEAEKKSQLERMRELCIMADNHYRVSLIKNHGFQPWRRLIQSMDRKAEVAVYQYNTKLLRKALAEWKLETDSAVEEREKKADALCRTVLLRRGLRSWMKYGERMEILEQKAIIHHDKALLKNYLRNWVDYTTDEKLSYWDKEARAEAHNRTRLLRRVFNVIRGYRTLVLREEERKKRLAEMRRKVTQLLPDFQHPRDSIASDITDNGA